MATLITRANANTRPSMRAERSVPATFGGRNDSSARDTIGATSRPSAPPPSAIHRLSASSRLEILRREAPRARRVRISRPRAAPRARSRLATLSEASRSSSSVPAISTWSGRSSRRRSIEWPWEAGVTASVEARNCARCSAVTRGKPSRRVSSSSIDLNQGWSPDCASSAVRPGRSRPNTCIHRARRSSSSSHSGVACRFIAAGIHSAGTSPMSTPRKLALATPTTVIGKLLTSTLRPTTSGAPPSAWSQYACESTTTGCAPGWASSSSCMRRPRAGLTPSTGKYEPETISAPTGSGLSPAAVARFTVVEARQQTPSKNRPCCCRSRQIGYDIRL